MGLETLLIVESLSYSRDDMCTRHLASWRIFQSASCTFPPRQRNRELDCGLGSASVSQLFFARGDQRGGAPPAADTAECAPQFY